MRPYVHKVQYYETDMMGVTHHSNYIRWMEEARVDFLEQAGFPYAKMEAEGVLSPVRSVACEYRRPARFGDEVEIRVTLEAFNGVKMAVAYDMRGPGGETVCTARSEHVFIDREGRLVRLKRVMPEFCRAMEALTAAEEPDAP